LAKTGDISPIFLSASTSGRQILVAATSTAGTLIHTAVSGATAVDYITIEACNTGNVSAGSTVRLTIEFGGVTDPDDHVVVDLEAGSGAVRVLTNRPLNGGLAVRAFADFANAVTIGGDVRRVTL
jgi:hypothetical protein